MNLKNSFLVLSYLLMGSVSFVLVMYLGSMFSGKIQAQEKVLPKAKEKTVQEKEEQKKTLVPSKKGQPRSQTETVKAQQKVVQEKGEQKKALLPSEKGQPRNKTEGVIQSQKKMMKEGVKRVEKVLEKGSILLRPQNKTKTTKGVDNKGSKVIKKNGESKTTVEGKVELQVENNVSKDDGNVKKIEGDFSEKNELELLEGIIENYEYKGLEGRDPFKEPALELIREETIPLGPLVGATQVLERYELDQLKLKGVIWGVDDPKALILDPAGQTHVVKKGQRMGKNRGKIVEIREEELIIMESYGNRGRYSFQTRVMRLSK